MVLTRGIPITPGNSTAAFGRSKAASRSGREREGGESESERERKKEREREGGREGERGGGQRE